VTAAGAARRLLEFAVAESAKDLGISPDLLRPTFSAVVQSDAMGTFRFADLAPGRYSIKVSKDGFFAPSVSGYTPPNVSKIVRVASTRTTAALDLFMVRGGVINGHVQDSSGRPVVAAIVQASQRSYPGGRFTLTLRTSESTDDGGNFRFADLLPGEYFLSVTTDTDELPARDRAPGVTATAERGAAALTYYPGVTDRWAAVPVIVQDASVTSGISIEVQNRKTSTFKISGVVLNNSPVFQRNPQAVLDRSVGTFYLVPLVADVMDNSPLAFRNSIPLESRPNGEFEIRKVPPGRYELYPAYRSPIPSANLPRVFTSRNPVEVRDADITNLSITVKPGATLSVQVVASPTSARSGFERLTLGLRVLDSMPRTFVEMPRQFDSAGQLTLQSIPEAMYALSLYGLPEGAYVSDVLQNGRSIYDDGFLLQEESDPIQILVSRDGGTVSGRIRSPLGPTADITVVLVPSLARRKNAALFKTATVDEDGAFTIRGVAPGPYTLVSMESRPSGEPWLNADFLAKYEGRGRAVRITAGSTIQLDFN
jgi:protocatechuate 3,4-dioxygenase beta subunit